MVEATKPNKQGLLSPQPKRFSINILDLESFELQRSQSCDTEQISAISELNNILSLSNFPIRNFESSPLFKKFSSMPPERTQVNPIVNDQKFRELEFSLSTSEDSSSDEEVFPHIN